MILNLADLRVELQTEGQVGEIIPGPEHHNLRCCGGADLNLRIFCSDQPMISPPTGLTVNLPSREKVAWHASGQMTPSWSMNHAGDRIEIQGTVQGTSGKCTWDMILRPKEGKGVLRVPTCWQHLDPLCYPVNYLLIHFAGLFRHSLVMHASAVEFKRGTCIFTGRSGIGKSTTASWCVGQGARLVHDDKVRICCRDASTKVHRMPSYPGWGPFSSDLRCIFILERLGHFSLEPLTPTEGIGHLLQNSQYFAASDEMIRLAFEAAGSLAERVPLYRLSLPYEAEAILEIGEILGM